MHPIDDERQKIDPAVWTTGKGRQLDRQSVPDRILHRRIRLPGNADVLGDGSTCSRGNLLANDCLDSLSNCFRPVTGVKTSPRNSAKGRSRLAARSP